MAKEEVLDEEEEEILDEEAAEILDEEAAEEEEVLHNIGIKFYCTSQ